MSIKQDIRPDIQKIISQIDKQIAYHEDSIKALRMTRKMWEEHKPEPTLLMKYNAPLTRDLVRNFMKMYNQPVQTVNVINLLYKNIDEAKRNKLVKTLSVMLNQMEKEDEVIIEKRKGVKGNFYILKK